MKIKLFMSFPKRSICFDMHSLSETQINGYYLLKKSFQRDHFGAELKLSTGYPQSFQRFPPVIHNLPTTLTLAFKNRAFIKSQDLSLPHFSALCQAPFQVIDFYRLS